MENSDIAAEKAVLSGIFQYGESCYYDVIEILKIEDVFTLNYNVLLFTCLKHMFETLEISKPDIATLYSAAEDLNLSESINSSEASKHISLIIEFYIEKENVRQHASKLAKLYVIRQFNKQLIKCQNDLSKMTGTESLADILSIIEDPVINLSKTINEPQDEPQRIGDHIEEFIKDKKENPGVPAISSGFPLWDIYIGGGLRYGSTSYIGARPKNYKSGFALNIGSHISQNLKIPVLYVDTELTLEEQIARLLSKQSKLSHDIIDSGEVFKDKSGEEDINKAMKSLKGIPFDHHAIFGKAFDYHISIMKRWLYKVPGIQSNGHANPCVIIYDYIKVMNEGDIDDANREYQVIGFRSTALQNFALRYNIPILVLTQLNKDGISRETSDVIAQSDRVGWFGSNFSILKEKSADEQNDCEGNYKIVPVQARHAKKIQQGDYINYDIKGDCFHIEEKCLRSEDRIKTNIPPDTKIEL